MEDFVMIYVIASLISLLILYFVIKSAVASALKESKKDDMETNRLLRSILVKLNGNVAEMAKVDQLLEEEFSQKKKDLAKKISSNRTYYSKLQELENQRLAKEFELKSKL